MTLSQENLLAFYENCNYWAAQPALRPSQLHIPILIQRYLKKDILTSVSTMVSKQKINMSVDAADCQTLASVLLHESLFHFFKAFYNYLAARALYFGGLEHWIDITLYYAKFYLARSVTTLCGKQQYKVGQQDTFFMPEIAESLKNNRGKKPTTYRICLNIDIGLKQGQIVIDVGKISSHHDVWREYRKLPVTDIGLYRLLLEGEGRNDTVFGIPLDYLIRARNKENYSFEGYWHLDFNVTSETFENNLKNYNYVRKFKNTIYDYRSGDVLLALSSQFRLFQMLRVDHLPIENNKFACMIDYYLPKSEAKEKLLRLCTEYFPTQMLYSEDGDIFYDEQNRAL